MKKYVLALIGALVLTACSKEQEVQPEMLKVDKVIFGGVYGMCGGDCRDLFLIDNNALYKDDDNEFDVYGDWVNTTFTEKLDQDTYNSTKDLLNVPSGLLNSRSLEKELVQSWADVDYYLYIEKDGKSREIILDHIHRDASPELKSYFRLFLKSYKDLGGYMIDTTNIERYY